MSLNSESRIELHLFSPQRDSSIIELLTAIAHYGAITKLDLNHSVNFGRPWLDSSLCEYGFISLPFLDGPDLEVLNYDGKEINFYWLIPITKEELNFKKEFGVDKLEEMFDQSNFNYLDPKRESRI